MGNEVAVLGMSREELMAATGQGDPNFTGGYLPKLGINPDAEDAEDKPIPRGSWKVRYEGKDVFSKSVSFRTYISTYQYHMYDAEQKKYTLQSTQFKNWGEVALDNQGNEFKAAAYKKSMLKINPELEKKIRCRRLLYGTVDLLEPVVDGVKQEPILNIPCVWYAAGNAFMIISEVIESLNKQQKLMLFYPVTMTTKKEKNGATTYFLPVASVKNEDDTGLDMSLAKETMGVFESLIKADNAKILVDFNKKRVTASDSFAQEVMNSFKPAETLKVDPDLNDPLDDIFSEEK